MFLTKYWKDTIRRLNGCSHVHTQSPTPKVRIQRKNIIKSSMVTSVAYLHAQTSSYVIPERTYEEVALENAIELIIKYLDLKYEDGKNVDAKLVKNKEK